MDLKTNLNLKPSLGFGDSIKNDQSLSLINSERYFGLK
jgi:hypothetical protein